MKKNNKNLVSVIKASSTGLVALGLASSANATLEVRLGGLAYYDTDLNITWLADANYAKTSGYDADGQMTWADANAWAASLNIGGVTGWRLPSADVNRDGTIVNCFGGGVVGCSDNEMGFLYWEESITAASPDVFSNVQSNLYWSGTEYAPVPTSAWRFLFRDGSQFAPVKSSNFFAWAVHSGDVGASAVPEPGTVALMGLGLLGLLGVGRRQRRG